jgi:hypothetical protein
MGKGQDSKKAVKKPKQPKKPKEIKLPERDNQ